MVLLSHGRAEKAAITIQGRVAWLPGAIKNVAEAGLLDHAIGEVKTVP